MQNDPAIVFPNAGFDSPEVQQQRAEQIAETFTAMLSAFQQAAGAIITACNALASLGTFAPMPHIIERFVDSLYAQHLIPRQHRETVMRKKLRRITR